MGTRARRLLRPFLQFLTRHLNCSPPCEVKMNPFRLIAATALLALASFASAQTQTDTGRGNTPPGMSRDGASPGDGAITGGSIAPGERGGIPSGRDTNAGREEALKRCNDLEGVLREQCQKNA